MRGDGMVRWLRWCALVAAAAVGAGEVRAADVDFQGEVLPLLAAHCLECHGPDRDRGGLRFTDPDTLFAGRDGGRAAVVPGDPDASELIRRVGSADPDYRMPPDDAEPLTAEQVETLRRWIEAGAEWEPNWSFITPRRPAVPAVEDAAAVATPIDHFIQARLEAQGIAPSPGADRYTLIRRLHLDLTGLAPTPEEAESFVHDDQPDAYERRVDALLGSPHFGERWGAHWLDVARYADSDGFERDYDRPGAWRWRQWVIEAINNDMPFDQFIVEQIAGDLLEGATVSQRLATGFHRNELHNTEAGIDVPRERFAKATRQLNAVGSAFMGLTVSCAECHTHKYDPIEHEAYYQMLDFFWGQMEERDVPAEHIEDPAERGLPVEPGTREGDALREYLGSDVYHLVMAPEERRETRVRIRGNFEEPGEVVEPGAPGFLPPIEARGEEPDRLDFARWIASPEHPLTARVAVNHVWQNLFGEGLMRTPDDFGLRGDRPTHPELLDWLAVELVESGWSRKHVIRRIVLSEAYRRDSAFREDLHRIDPENPGAPGLARQRGYRLPAELVRDNVLRAGGLLVERIGGRSFRAPLPGGLDDLGWGSKWNADEGTELYRRAIYMAYRRNFPNPMLATFDHPDTSMACPEREVSATPMQALTLWNSPITFDAARALGLRVAREVAGGPAEGAERLFRLCMTRPPTEAELAEVVGLYHRLHEEYAGNPSAAEELLRVGADGGAAARAGGVEPAEAAAWAVAARALFALEETHRRD